MTDTSPSIDELIQTHNPFAGHTVVRPQQIWGESFPDVSSINAHVSNTVLEAVQKVNQGQLHHIGITITGEKGLGKTQVISRIRHRLKENDDTLFIYMGQYGNLNLIKSEFLHHVATSLRAFGQYQGVMQCQEIAAALINEAMNFEHSPAKYIKNFPKPSTVDKLVNRILNAKPELDNPYLVKAIIWTLSPQHCKYANYWISGENLTQTKAEELGLPFVTKEERKENAFQTVCEILNFISLYKIPVICFDELDKPECDKDGYLLAQVVAVFAKDLSNNLKRSILLLSMYEEIWIGQVKNLAQAEAVIDRITNYPLPREPLHLKYLNEDDVIAVVSHWLKEFYQKHQQTPPSLLYPFQEHELREFGKNRPTVRDVLSWCAKKFQEGSIETPLKSSNLKPSNSVEPVFENELSGLEDPLNNILDDNNTIANVLRFSFERLINKTVDKVTVQSVEDFKVKNCYLHFKVVCQENGKVVKIGIAVVQQSAGNSIQAILGQLVNYQKFDLTRGCLVRSKTISANAKKAQKYFQELVNEKGGEWVKLEADHLKPLYALSSVYNIREQYNLSEQQIFDFIDERKLVIDNELICEILSDPSGEIPDNLTDEDIPINLSEDTSDLESDFDL